MLAQGLLGVLDISLRDEVVVGLITCGRLVLGQGAKVLSGSTQGIYPRHHAWKLKVSGSRNRKVIRERDDDEGDEVNGEVEETSSNAHSTHES